MSNNENFGKVMTKESLDNMYGQTTQKIEEKTKKRKSPWGNMRWR